MIIRQASIQDTTHVLPLMNDLGYPMTEEAFAQRMEIYTSSTLYGAFVAEERRKIAGFAALSISELILKPGRRCHLEALIVQQEYRGLGVGRQLIEAVEEYAHQHGCVVIDLTSGIRRVKDGSHDFYRHLGYANDGFFAKAYFRNASC